MPKAEHAARDGVSARRAVIANRSSRLARGGLPAHRRAARDPGARARVRRGRDRAVRGRVGPGARLPARAARRLGELGLMGVCVPEELGGAGADFLSYILVLEELSRADAGVGRDGRGAHERGHAADPRLRHRRAAERFVPPLARGETGRRVRADRARLRLRRGLAAHRCDAGRADGWTISGTKQWITNGDFAGTFLLFARTDPETPGPRPASRRSCSTPSTSRSPGSRRSSG